MRGHISNNLRCYIPYDILACIAHGIPTLKLYKKQLKIGMLYLDWCQVLRIKNWTFIYRLTYV